MPKKDITIFVANVQGLMVFNRESLRAHLTEFECHSEKEILSLYNRGMLTSEEEAKYKVWELQKKELDKLGLTALL